MGFLAEGRRFFRTCGVFLQIGFTYEALGEGEAAPRCLADIAFTTAEAFCR
jgi:hypothetical protein